ncbi:hypothetical protein GW17_00056161 [Ensete ventricosum]|nr:hypothetical protein GW17_00056161 [Ensete ventricosum]
MTYPTSLRGSRNDPFATHVSHARLFLLLCPLSLSLSLPSSLSPLDIKIVPLHRFSLSFSRSLLVRIWMQEQVAASGLDGSSASWSSVCSVLEVSPIPSRGGGAAAEDGDH